MIWNLLTHLGFDLVCLCGHRKSEHDFDSLTPAGFCQHGNWRSGCSCMYYEPKGLRPVEPNRHVSGLPQ